MLRSQKNAGLAKVFCKWAMFQAMILMLPGWAIVSQNRVTTLTENQKREAMTGLIEQLLENYVFPDTAKSLAELLETNFKSGLYNSLNHPDQFADAVTKDLQSLNRDQHLKLTYQLKQDTPISNTHDQVFFLSRGKNSNYGFEQVAILDGNIGYIKMGHFSLDQLFEEARATITAAMAFVSNTDALIIDLRSNAGGSARMVRYLASYLFDETPVHLNDYYFRTNDQTLVYSTLADIPGKRLPNIPTYVLINKHTFSAAEAFAYNLKHLGRVTVIGESSAGGAHGGSTRRVSEQFTAYIPFSRSIHPITKTDWEGTGVSPQITASSDEAMLVAHITSLQNLQKSSLNQINSELYRKTLKVLNIKKSPITVPLDQLQRYVGNYEMGPGMHLKIRLKQGILYGQMTGDSQSIPLMPVSQIRFRADAYNKEFSFKLDEADMATGLTLHEGNGIFARKVK